MRINVGAICIDEANRFVRINGHSIETTTAEFELLFYLARHAGEILTRDRIYKGIRSIAWDGLERSIDLRIVRLRRKLGESGKQPKIIKTIRGEGYLLVADP